MTEVQMLPLKEIHPYGKNPRKNDASVDAVANSIREFGFRAPIIVDADRTIIAGHTRYKAAKKLRLKKVPVIVAEDMTPEQAEAYRIADNSAGSASEWDFDILGDLLEGIEYDMADFGLDILRNDEEPIFGELDRMMGEKDEDYQAFEDKFKPKYTTDDCFTPPEVYDALKGWVMEKYGIGEDVLIVRPFYPGADYTTEKYPDGCLVLDNPPFSITSEIIRYYIEHKIDFFLFTNHLTACHPLNIPEVNLVIVGVAVTFENGANLPLSFVTNLGENRIEVAGDLYSLLDEVQPSTAREVGLYKYPDNIATAASLGKLSKYGCVFSIRDILPIKKMDEGPEIYGSGALISDPSAERVKAERVKAERVKTEYKLTARERELVEKLNREEAEVDG